MLNRDLICTNIEEFAEAKTVAFLNPYSYLKLYHANLDLNKFDKICIDGITLKIFLDLVYSGSKIARLSFDFTSVANLAFQTAANNAQRGFILGSDEVSNNRFLTKITKMFPGVSLDGRSGYFDNDEELTNFQNMLAKSDYDFIVIGMGAVKQEAVAIALKESGFRGRIYTCGGFIHQTALGSEGQYYPAWVDKLNLRFAYRMFKEPSTVQRYLFDYPKAFILLSRNIKELKH